MGGIIRRRRVPIGPLLAALLLLWPMGAVAQYGRPLHTMVKLTDSDLVIVRKIVREDFTDKPSGTTIAWENPESQNSGKVTLLDRFTSQGRDCRKVRYLVEPGPKQPPATTRATYVLTSCRLADGSWKLDDSARRDAG